MPARKHNSTDIDVRERFPSTSGPLNGCRSNYVEPTRDHMGTDVDVDRDPRRRTLLSFRVCLTGHHDEKSRATEPEPGRTWQQTRSTCRASTLIETKHRGFTEGCHRQTPVEQTLQPRQRIIQTLRMPAQRATCYRLPAPLKARWTTLPVGTSGVPLDVTAVDHDLEAHRLHAPGQTAPTEGRFLPHADLVVVELVVLADRHR